MKIAKKTVKRVLYELGYEIKPKWRPEDQEAPSAPKDPKDMVPGEEFVNMIPDAEWYVHNTIPYPVFSPWLGYGEFAHFAKLAEPHTLVSPDRIYVLYSLALQALKLGGEFWECGVYKGGTARMLAEFIATKAKPDGQPRLRLFDTFEGMPETDAQRDTILKGIFADTSLEAVRGVVGPGEHVSFHQGFIPETFRGLEESRIAFAHIDVDIYKSEIDCCDFIYPRLIPGGFMVFDDYGTATCPGARLAVDEFFANKKEHPLVMPTGQAVVFAMG